MSSLFSLALLFLGMALGTLSPLGIWGFIIFITTATIFFFIDVLIDIKDKKL